jgi:chromosome segregation ATPase
MDDGVNDRLERARARAAEKKALDSRLATVLRQKKDRRASLEHLADRLRGAEADVLRAKVARDACAEDIEKLSADETRLGERIAALGDVASELDAALRDEKAVLAARGRARTRNRTWLTAKMGQSPLRFEVG